MNIAIVGTSKLELDEEDKVKCYLEDFVRFNLEKDVTVITGDASGVDYLVRMWIPRQMLRVIRSEGKEWKYFKERNKKIATAADLIICITTKMKEERCYHCDKDHQRTGGCWTMQYGVKKLGCKGELIVI